MNPLARRQRSRLLAPIIALMLIGVLVGCGGADSDSGGNGVTFNFVIPDGSAERIEQGEKLEILPRELVAELGETIQIVNEDDDPHFLGPWFLGPGETLRQRFVTVGVFEGTCSVHPSGEFTVVVEEPDA